MVNGKCQWPQTLDLFFVVIYNRSSSCKIRKPLSVYDVFVYDVLQFKVG